MKVKIFRQRITQIHEGEEEINTWLAESEGAIEIEIVQQSAYLTDGGERAAAGYIVTVWYNETGQ
jgi:hypothetical protein